MFDPMSVDVDVTFGARFEQRLARLREEAPYRTYEAVRERVLALLDEGAASATRPSEYWVTELGTLEYLLDASPLIVNELRHHTYPVTGIRPYDYRSGKDSKRFADKVAMLTELAGGDHLLVPESPALGGFGHELDGRLYNVDTLKYFEVLIGMERAGVLGALRGAEQRPCVLEIGAGWGGFAYQLKRLFPAVTYVIVDLPLLFLYSATYVETVFPEATTWYWERPGDERSIPADADFAFVPYFALEGLELDRLDLTVNMVSFQEMTEAQVKAYAAKAHALSSTFLYSLNRERSHYNDELTSVSAALETCFWLRQIPLLNVNYMKLSGAKRASRGEQDANDYRHLVGTPRMLR
jgi:hypothetical protein